MENFIFSLNATLPIFLTMVVGYVIRQLGIVKDPFIKDLNSFNYKITLPFLLSRTSLLQISMPNGIPPMSFFASLAP